VTDEVTDKSGAKMAINWGAAASFCVHELLNASHRVGKNCSSGSEGVQAEAAENPYAMGL
jgi:hypothetical protein